MPEPSPAQSPTIDGTLTIEPALVMDPSGNDWNLNCDVLVIGFGAAGASAALAARKHGAKVIVADRFDGGGASAKSGGIVYAGGGTPHQKKAGYDDTPEEMFKYLRMETGDSVSDATLRQFCEDSRGIIEWLESMGANFESDVPPPKTSYPKDGVYLYYSGNEAVAEYAAVARPAPRGHRTRGSWLSGKAMFEFLRAEVSRVGVHTLTQTAARRLITDAGGKVLGAELWQLEPGSAAARKHDKLIQKAEKVFNVFPGWADRLRARARALEMEYARPLRVRASKGVVLSAGGFIFNREMVARHAPKYKMTMRLGTAGCDGSGIRLGLSVGAVADKLNHVSAWRFINPPIAWPKGIAINTKGERFCNEQVYGAKLGVEMCEFHDGKAVTSEDVVASLKRWASRDSFGGVMAKSVDSYATPDAKTFVIKLKQPFGVMLEALGKLTNGAYFVQTVPPGLHTFTASTEPEFKDSLKLQIDPGETYFVEGILTKGVVIGAADLTPSDRATFQKAAMSLKVAQSQ